MAGLFTTRVGTQNKIKNLDTKIEINTLIKKADMRSRKKGRLSSVLPS